MSSNPTRIPARLGESGWACITVPSLRFLGLEGELGGGVGWVVDCHAHLRAVLRIE